MKVRDITVSRDVDNRLQGLMSVGCYFCKKEIKVESDVLPFLLNKNQYFCPFCIRRNYHQDNKNILIASFRGIIGYYYYQLYFQNKSLWFNEITQMIDRHEEIGSCYPFLSYDPETFLWFLRIENSAITKKIANIMLRILDVFNLDKHTSSRINEEVSNYVSSSIKFPKNKKPLIPILENLDFDFDFEYTKYFIKKHLIIQS